MGGARCALDAADHLRFPAVFGVAVPGACYLWFLWKRGWGICLMPVSEASFKQQPEPEKKEKAENV